MSVLGQGPLTFGWDVLEWHEPARVDKCGCATKDYFAGDATTLTVVTASSMPWSAGRWTNPRSLTLVRTLVKWIVK